MGCCFHFLVFGVFAPTKSHGREMFPNHLKLWMVNHDATRQVCFQYPKVGETAHTACARGVAGSGCKDRSSCCRAIVGCSTLHTCALAKSWWSLIKKHEKSWKQTQISCWFVKWSIFQSEKLHLDLDCRYVESPSACVIPCAGNPGKVLDRRSKARQILGSLGQKGWSRYFKSFKTVMQKC